MKTYRGAVFFLCAIAVAGAERLSSPSRALAVTHDFSNKPIPRYSHGFPLAYDNQLSKVWAYKDGALSTEATVSVPGYASARIRGISSSPGGAIAVTVSLSDPRLGLAAAIVWIDSTGKTLRSVKTSPFAASRIAFAADGTLWALGRVHDASYREVPHYDMLRQYDTGGTLVRWLLPRDSVPQRAHASEAMLSLQGDRILIYFQPERLFTELSTAGSVAGQWKVNPFPAIEVTGTALTDSGEIYVSAMPARRQTPADWDTLTYKLDKRSSQLVPVDATRVVPHGKFAMVLGSDPGALVFYTRMPRMLEWVPVN